MEWDDFMHHEKLLRQFVGFILEYKNIHHQFIQMKVKTNEKPFGFPKIRKEKNVFRFLNC